MLGAYILVALTLPALAREIAEVVCRIRKRGLVLDARAGTLRIRRMRDLPGGVVLVIGKDGSTTSYSVCDGKTDLTALIKAASAAP